jgi:hypothetical protein
VVDVLAGVVYALIVHFLVRRWESRRRRRVDPGSSASASASPEITSVGVETADKTR